MNRLIAQRKILNILIVGSLVFLLGTILGAPIYLGCLDVGCLNDEKDWIDATPRFITLAITFFSEVGVLGILCWLDIKLVRVENMARAATRRRRSRFVKLSQKNDVALFSDIGSSADRWRRLEYVNGNFALLLAGNNGNRIWRGKSSDAFSLMSQTINAALFDGVSRRGNILAARNWTANKDGQHELYLLNVPIEIKDVNEAIAWTFGVDSKDYVPSKET